jgi:hypothetical protein
MARPKKNPEAAPKAPAPLRVFMVQIGGGAPVYVRSATKAQALKHAMQSSVTVVGIADEVVKALGIEAQVQHAGPPIENPSF